MCVCVCVCVWFTCNCVYVQLRMYLCVCVCASNGMMQPPLPDPDGVLLIEVVGNTINMSVMRQATQSTKKGVPCTPGRVIEPSKEKET